MMQFLKSIWEILSSSITNIIRVITKIPIYFNSFKGYFNMICLEDEALILILTVIISIGILIKIKRLII